MSARQIQAGDRVQWTHTSRRGRSISMALREGTVEAVAGAVATVRYGKKTMLQLPLGALHAVGAPSRLGAVVEAIRAAGRERGAR